MNPLEMYSWYKSVKDGLSDKKALLAQLAERSLSKRKVGGSIPPGGSLFSSISIYSLHFFFTHRIFP